MHFICCADYVWDFLLESLPILENTKMKWGLLSSAKLGKAELMKTPSRKLSLQSLQAARDFGFYPEMRKWRLEDKKKLMKYHLDGLNIERCVGLLIWRLEIRDEDVHRPMLPLKMPGKDPFQASFLASSSSLTCGNITPIFTWHSPMCMSVAASNFPLSIKPSVRLGYTQMTSF